MPLPVETEMSRHPFEVFILTVLVLVGASIVVGGAPPPSIAALGSGDGVLWWGVLLTSGALVSLVGAYWRTRVTSLLLTQIGMVALGSAALMYSVAVLINFGAAGFLSATVSAWFGFNALRRWVQIQAEIDAADRKSRQDGGR